MSQHQSYLVVDYPNDGDFGYTSGGAQEDFLALLPCDRPYFTNHSFNLRVSLRVFGSIPTQSANNTPSHLFQGLAEC